MQIFYKKSFSVCIYEIYLLVLVKREIIVIYQDHMTISHPRISRSFQDGNTSRGVSILFPYLAQYRKVFMTNTAMSTEIRRIKNKPYTGRSRSMLFLKANELQVSLDKNVPNSSPRVLRMVSYLTSRVSKRKRKLRLIY